MPDQSDKATNRVPDPQRVVPMLKHKGHRHVACCNLGNQTWEITAEPTGVHGQDRGHVVSGRDSIVKSRHQSTNVTLTDVAGVRQNVWHTQLPLSLEPTRVKGYKAADARIS